MRRFTWVLILSFLFVGVQAGDNLPENFHLKKLDNGLEVLVIEDSSVPLVTIELVVRNGAYTESPEYDGLSHLYEHMFFKANKVYPSQEDFMNRVDELGIVFNGTTSNERVNYFFHTPSDNLVDGLQFMNDAIRYPLFLEEEMKKENVVVDGEFQRNESNPVFFLYDETAKHVWGSEYSRKNTIGDHDIIKSATPEKMNIIKEKYYHPNNSLLAIAGDVNHEVVFREVERIYKDWEASRFDPFERFPIPEFDPLKGVKKFVVENENAQVPIFMYTYHGPDTRGDIESTYAADVFSFILSQKTSKFYKAMVESGLALQTNVSYQTCKFTGPINVFLVPNPAKVKEALAALAEEMEKWDQDDYFTDEQLQISKDLLAIDDAYSKEKTSEFIHTVTYWWASADIPYYTNYIDNIQKVTREDIKKYVQTYIKGKAHVEGLLINPEQRKQLGMDEIFKVD